MLTFTLLILFGVALAIRVYDITDLPLDFHPTRQLFSAVKARGMYYETLTDVPEAKREFAIQQWKTRVTIEPEILERLAAFIYRYTGEQLWIPRLISAFFWLVGGIFIFLLTRDLVSTDGAVLSLAFYLLVPYGIYASRSFQPDPMMVVLIVAFWWLVYRWTNQPAWQWAILAGLIGGLAIFVKFVAAFFVVGGALGALLGGDLSGRFIPSLLSDLFFYAQWQTKAASVAGGIGIMLGLLGIVFIRERVPRMFLLGIWGAYLVFGIYFNYHISTHDYYSLPLIAIVAVSLAPVGDWFFSRLGEAESGWVRSAVFVILVYGVLSTVWNVRNEMKSVDYRPQEAYWADIGNLLGSGASVVALTEDYGNRLAYWGWQKATIWPSSGDLYQAQARGNQRNIDRLFAETAAQKSLFLVTDLEDFSRQVELQSHLAGYPVLVQGDGYLIYDLGHPLGTQP